MVGVLGREAARLWGEREAPRLQVVLAQVWRLSGPRATHPGCVMRRIHICAQAPLGSRDESGLVRPMGPLLLAGEGSLGQPSATALGAGSGPRA